MDEVDKFTYLRVIISTEEVINKLVEGRKVWGTLGWLWKESKI